MDDFELHPLTADQWPPELSHILDELHGSPINLHSMVANSPALMNAYWPLRNYLIKRSGLGQRRSELVILRLAVHRTCWYQWADHVDRSLRLGIEIEDILASLKPITEWSWSETDRALIMAVDDLMNDHRIRPVTLAILDKHFSNQQVIDLVALTGFCSMLSGILQSWRVPLDEDIEARVTTFIDRFDFQQRAEAISNA